MNNQQTWSHITNFTLSNDALDREFERIREVEGKSRFLTRKPDMNREREKRAKYVREWWDTHPADFATIRAKARLGVV